VGLTEPLDGRGAAIQAKVGDPLVMEGRTVGQPRREVETLQVRDTDGTPPYVVRWEDGHDGVTYPGSDASVTHSA
jgi:Domain of unknown function (DUF1918)